MTTYVYEGYNKVSRTREKWRLSSDNRPIRKYVLNCNYFNWICPAISLNKSDPFTDSEASALVFLMCSLLSELFCPYVFVFSLLIYIFFPLCNKKKSQPHWHSIKRPTPSMWSEIIITNDSKKHQLQSMLVQSNYSMFLYIIIHLHVLVSVGLCSHKTVRGRL